MDTTEIRNLLEAARPPRAVPYVTLDAKAATALVDAVSCLVDRVEALDAQRAG